jgi:type VI secretion system protein ImpH
VELIFQRAVRGDTAARDFLDIFNHRLISFVYRIRKKHRIGLGVSSPEEDSAAGHLYSLLGLGFPELKNRLGVNDRALLTHTLTLGNDTRSLEGLVAILRHHFGMAIEAIPLTGSFHAIESSNRTAIGRTGRNRVLGRDAVLGGRFWDQESAFEIRVGPMKLDTFLRFLPSGDALGPRCALVRFYAGPRYRFGLQLILEPFEMPQAKLGDATATRLGQLGVLGGPKRQSGKRLEIRLSRAAVEKGLAEKIDVDAKTPTQ